MDWLTKGPHVRLSYEQLSSNSKSKLHECLQSWSQWHMENEASKYLENHSLSLENGNFIYFPDLQLKKKDEIVEGVQIWADLPGIQVKNSTETPEFNTSAFKNSGFNNDYSSENTVPLYDRNENLCLKSTPNHSLSLEDRKVEQQRCFNCGSYSHDFKNCSKPRDESAIATAREKHKMNKASSGLGSGLGSGSSRYYVRETFSAKSSGFNNRNKNFHDLEPGKLVPELLEALAITEFDPPPWLSRMKELGCPPDYMGIEKEPELIIFDDIDNFELEVEKEKEEKIRKEDEGEGGSHGLADDQGNRDVKGEGKEGKGEEVKVGERKVREGKGQCDQEEGEIKEMETMGEEKEGKKEGKEEGKKEEKEGKNEEKERNKEEKGGEKERIEGEVKVDVMNKLHPKSKSKSTPSIDPIHSDPNFVLCRFQYPGLNAPFPNGADAATWQQILTRPSSSSNPIHPSSNPIHPSSSHHFNDDVAIQSSRLSRFGESRPVTSSYASYTDYDRPDVDSYNHHYHHRPSPPSASPLFSSPPSILNGYFNPNHVLSRSHDAGIPSMSDQYKYSNSIHSRLTFPGKNLHNFSDDRAHSYNDSSTLPYDLQENYQRTYFHNTIYSKSYTTHSNDRSDRLRTTSSSLPSPSLSPSLYTSKYSSRSSPRDIPIPPSSLHHSRSRGREEDRYDEYGGRGGYHYPLKRSRWDVSRQDLEPGEIGRMAGDDCPDMDISD